jgi:hypothetical protein
MKRSAILLGLAVLLLPLTTSCEKQEKVTGTSGEEIFNDGSAGVPDSLVLARSFAPLLANGVDEISIQATVVDGRGRGLENIGVAFTTSHGAVEPFATTDQDGVARTTLTSAASVEDLVATVTARASSDSVGKSAGDSGNGGLGAHVLLSRTPLSPGVIAAVLPRLREAAEDPGASLAGAPATSSTGIVFDQVSVPMTGITLSVDANPAIIPADGVSQSQVVASLIETTRRIPLEGKNVRFGATAGSISGRAVTDVTGSAVATLTGLTSGTTSGITVFYGNTLTAAATVTFSPLTLEVEPAEPVLLADGASTTSVVARLINQEGNPVGDARIDFSTSLGTISSPIVTDSLGEAAAVLTVGTTPGTAQITARFSTTLSAEATVTFAAPPNTAQILLSAVPSSLAADGTSESTLSATALDPQGDPMPDGTVVTFSVTSGTGRIVGPSQTTQDGVAEATYVAGTSAGSVTIAAQSGSATGNVTITLRSVGPGEVILSADPAVVLADGLASTAITAQVNDAFGNPVGAGITVDFTATLGILESASPTDASGAATVRLSSERNRTGTARVSATVGSAQGVVDIHFVSESAAHIVVAAVERSQIGVLGSGAPETSTVTFEVEDAHGIPVDSEHAVELQFSVVPPEGGIDATLFPESATTNERGLAATTVGAGTISGTLEVLARSGGLESRPIRIAIHGDLPDPRHFSISMEKLNIAGLVFDGLRNGVTARVGDVWGNPVPDSTVVWFNAAYGLVQGSAFTDDHGEATVWEVTAGPHPLIPGGDGLVELCAQTISKAGDTITTCGSVLWSGPTIVEIVQPASGFAVPNGESITVTYRVRDANSNPLTGGTVIHLTSNAGDLQGDVDFTLPDTQSQAFTTFHAVLADDNAGTDQPQSVTVTVSVTSQNGDGAASVTGTLH